MSADATVVPWSGKVKTKDGWHRIVAIEVPASIYSLHYISVREKWIAETEVIEAVSDLEWVAQSLESLLNLVNHEVLPSIVGVGDAIRAHSSDRWR